MGTKTKLKSAQGSKIRVTLHDGQRTTVHVVKHPRLRVKPRIVAFDDETKLLDWCRQNEVGHAINGGFFVREDSKPLGDMWINGVAQPTVSFVDPWCTNRGSIHINNNNETRLAPRHHLPENPDGDLLQSGPLLVQDGESLISEHDTEGFSAGAHQFDTDITSGRYPRAAIGMCEDYIWCVVADGRHDDEAGLTFSELADLFVSLGVKHALNLDGGSSSSLVYNGELINKPRSDYELFHEGRPIHTAVIFDYV